jgi:hypothetical protein
LQRGLRSRATQRSSVARAYDRLVPRNLRTLLIALPVLALAAAGCGGSSAKPAPDPASVVPASAPLYANAIVRPQGTLKTDADAASKALTHEAELYGGLLATLGVGGTTSATPHSRSEIESWLGERAGVFITHLSVASISTPAELLALVRNALAGQLFGAGVGGAQAEGALVLDVTDSSKARAFIADVQGARSATFGGVDYSVAPTGEAYGLVGDFMVIGSESGLKEVISVSKGAAPLETLPAYTELRDAAAKEAVLANVYVKTTTLLRTTRVVHGSASQLLGLVGALAPGGTLYLSLAPQSHQVRLDIDASSGGQTQAPSATESEQAALAQQLFQGLPEDSWFALRLHDFGAFAKRALALASGPAGTGGGGIVHALLGSLGGSSGSLLGSLAPSLEAVLASLESKQSLVNRELLSWMGPAGIFISGSGVAEFNAAAVINVKEEAGAREAISKLPSILAGSGATVKPVVLPGTEAAVAIELKGLPLPLQVAAAKDKFVIGIGLSPVAAALMPTGTLGSSSAYQTAVKALGEGIQPALMLNVQTLVSFANVLGLSSGGTLAQLLPYLKSVTTLTGGTKQLGNISRIRLLLGVG